MKSAGGYGMSYAVIHMQKIKMGGVRGIQNHNERIKESHTNPDIDYSKSSQNKIIDNQPDDKTYYNRIRDRIKDLDLPKAVRKDAVTMCGFICTSDKAFFEKMTPEQQDQFFQESYNFLKERYGEKNIVAATVHLDETTPHMHYYMVPVTTDGRLSAKDIFTKTELQRLQTEYHRHMKSEGFDLDRGVSSDRKHLDVQEFKLETKKQEIAKTRAELDKLQEVKTFVSIDVEKGALGYSTKDVEELKKLAEAQRLEKYELEQTIRKHESKIVSLEYDLKNAQKKVDDIKPLISELETLKNENRALQIYLDHNPQAMKELEKHMSFKKQVHAEGKALAELKKKYVELSSYEVSHHRAMQSNRVEYGKSLIDISNLEKRQKYIQELESKLSQLQGQRKEIGEISLKNAFKGAERKTLDYSIEQHANSLKQATDDLQTVYGIPPEQIEDFIKNLQARAEELVITIKEQEQTENKLHAVKTKTLNDYKYYKAKTGLYSEPYRNIVDEKIKHISADYNVDKELKTLSKADIQDISERLPDGLKGKFQKQIQDHPAKTKIQTMDLGRSI
jgi:Chromosome segregation ATPases